MPGFFVRLSTVAFLVALWLPPGSSADDAVDTFASALTGPPVAIQAAAMPLGDFVESAMGKLGVAFALGPGIRERSDTVTLRLAAPVPPLQFFRITRRILHSMGLSVSLRSGVVVVSRGVAEAAPPYGADGKVPAEADSDQRVAVAVPLTTARHTAITPWLSQAFGGAGVSADQEPSSGMLLLSGPAASVEDALRAVRLLDQPLRRASDGVLLKPRYLAPEELAAALLPVLQAEGIDADNLSLGATLVILPLQSIRAVAVFTADRGLGEHVAEWARALDRPTDGGQQGPSVFSYTAHYALATDLVAELDALQPSAPAQHRAPAPPDAAAKALPEPPAAPDPEQDGAPEAGQALPVKPAQMRHGRLAADPNRNVVMFLGPASEWRQLYPALREMDTLAPSVQIEVIILELTLDKRFSSGLEWLASGSVRGDDVEYGTLGGLGQLQSGFQVQIKDRSKVRALLDLVASDSAVRVQARERLLVSSGRPARLDVGADVPVLSSSSRPVNSSGAPVTNSVEYRSTGLGLAVLPSLRPGGDMDLEISQDLSSAVGNTSSGIQSPTIRASRLRTTVSARDGAAVVLGGLEAVEAGESDLRALPMRVRGDGSRGRSAGRKELLLVMVPHLAKPGGSP